MPSLGKRKNLENQIEYVHGQITEYSGPKVDVSIGIGLFDYIENPVPLLAQMTDRTKGRVIASFPRNNTWRAPVRKMRLAVKGCDVFFYSRSDVYKTLHESGLLVTEMEQIGNLYCVVGIHK